MRTNPQDAEQVECIDDQAYKNLDKRGSQEPLPSDLATYLSGSQFRCLHHLEEFGWQLAFIRRPLFETPTVVLLSPEGKQFATIEEDGSLNLEPNLLIREDSVGAQLPLG